MAKAPSSSEIRRKMRAAQRKAEREVKRDVDRYNQKVDRQNRAAVAKYNREVDSNNRAADRHNKRVVAQLNRQLQGTVRSVAANYSPEESVLAERVQEAIAVQETREYDIFLSYARIDGFEVARKLREYLHDLGVSVW
jgi:transketolase